MGHLVFNIDVILKNGKAKAIKVSTIESLCEILDCQPGDLFEYVKDSEEE